MTSLYTVVYGSEWEDICYFSDVYKAQKKLVIQTLGVLGHQTRVYPCMYEYQNQEGVYAPTKHACIVDPQHYNLLSTLNLSNPDAIQSVIIHQDAALS